MRDQYVDRCDLLNVINAYFSPYITCTVHMLVYNMVHIFLHGSMSGFYVFVLCLPTLWVELLLGLFGWFPLLSFRHFSLTYQHNVIGIWEGQSKTVFIFHLSPLSLKLFLALWWWMEAFCGTKMHVGRSWVWLSFRCFVFFTLSACYQFLWTWQNGPKLKSWKTHFVIFSLLYNKRKMETSAALGSIVP